MGLKVFETFAGIGAQHKALRNLKQLSEKYDAEVKAISEWDIYSLIAYDAIHKGNINANEIDKYLLKNRIFDYNKYLSNFTFSRDGKEPYNSINRLDPYLKKRLIVANHRSKNLGSITKISARDIINKDINLITYSFPCQDLSIASMGRGNGMSKGTNTRSGLLWEIERILAEIKDIDSKKLPRYLLLENVVNMLSDRHISDYHQWVNFLKDQLGYNTYTLKLNALDFMVSQQRTRVFAISILKEFDHTQELLSEIYENFNSKDVDVWLTKYLKVSYANLLQASSGKSNNLRQKKITSILKLDYQSKTQPYLIEAIDALINDTESRHRIVNGNKKLNYNTNFLSTLTTKQDRHPNVGIVKMTNNYEIENKLCCRFITNREAYLAMGFDEDDYISIKNEIVIKKEHMYKQAGNSIVVNVLEAIFAYLFKMEEMDNE